MTAYRVATGGLVDRSKTIRFTFDGKTVEAVEGDTIASALLASGVSIVARSFKYHRPRGVWGAGVEEPNAIVDVSGPVSLTNARATTVLARNGMIVCSVNAAPTAVSDRNAFIDRFARFIPAAFYYKTFMFPTWSLFEPSIRKMAGLGTIVPEGAAVPAADQVNVGCDVLVVGAGPAGLLAALRAAETGCKVILCDDGFAVGGSLLHRSCSIDGMDGRSWADETVARLHALGASVLTRTTAFGIYDHGLVALSQLDAANGRDRLWRVRPGKVILATGAIERSLPFANNDRPGVMLAEAGLAYLKRYGVAPGRKVVVATNNSVGKATADELSALGISVTLVDSRNGSEIATVNGAKHVESVTLSDGSTITCDAVLVSGGFTPTLHLYCQAKGKLTWDETLQTFVAGAPVPGISVAGAAAACFDIALVVDSVRLALSQCEIDAGNTPASALSLPAFDISPAWPKPGQSGRIWIDLQNDVTAKDIELAARENFVSVEHLKRYTTLGMATDQGKTSNLAGIALMASLTDRSIPEVGTTTYRPPFTPVPFTSLSGARQETMLNPPRRLALEEVHRVMGARLMEYGGWIRPSHYGEGPMEEAAQREALAARESVAIFDGSPLGKIEVVGPQAAELLDFVFYNSMSSLKPGRCRYGLILSESGLVYDDGVVIRVDENRFIVSCSSSHVAGVHTMLESWRQDRFSTDKVFIHNATTAYATVTLSGPKSKAVLEAAGLVIDDATLAHMTTSEVSLGDLAVRVTRVSFTGDRSYEVSVRADQAERLWQLLSESGKPFGIAPIGMEALLILRAEKGYIVIGKDTDGTTLPMDLGMNGPLKSKRVEFSGNRSLLTAEATRPDRPNFIGLEVMDDGGPFAPGAHGIEMTEGRLRSLGYITSSYHSPTLNKPIALALIERGYSRIGDIIEVQHLGARRRARICAPCVFDPEGDRLNG